MTLDLNFVRSQFPAFAEPSLDGWAFFENAGGSYSCNQFVDRLTSFYTKNKVQPYYRFPASSKAGELMDESYQRMAEYLNVDASEIHFGPSTSQNVYVLANAMRPMWNDGDEIIVSCQDHEANAGAWRRLADRGMKVTEWHVDPETGLLDIEDLKNLLSSQTKLVAFPHCSNVIGYINPVKEISQLAHSIGALTVVDGVGYAPHGFPDIKEIEADIYFFSLYKTFGPHLGLMYVQNDLTLKMENQSHFFKDGITRGMITPAGPDHAQIGAVSGIIDYFDLLYDHHFSQKANPAERSKALTSLIREHETTLLEPLLKFLQERDDVRIVGPGDTESRLPIVAFMPLQKDIEKVYESLVSDKIMPGIGDFYAVRPLMEMGIPLEPGVIRLSFIHYTTMGEVQQLIQALEKALDE